MRQAAPQLDLADDYRFQEEERKGGRESSAVCRVGSRTFYRVGPRWEEAGYDGTTKTKLIVAFSDEYFELLRRHEDLAACLALGDRVVVIVEGTTYEIVPDTGDSEMP